MSLLDRKLMRDIFTMRGQITTIAMVVAAGTAVFVASISSYNTLRATSDRFYSDTHFPQIFVTLKRAPLSVVAQLAEIPGIASVEPRIVRDVILNWPSAMLPVSARMVSISHAGDEPLAKLHIRQGTAPEPGDTGAVAVSEAFAEANSVRLGTELSVLLNGRIQNFRIAAIALSPEYVYAVKPGVPIPDDRFYALLWVDRSAAEGAFDMKGAFNDAIVTLTPDTNPKQVIDQLDRLLEPYGSVGAVTRRDQPSNRFLEDELNQQKIMSVTIPTIFFGVAAFLLNVVLGRLVTAQREQIAALKALGFPTSPLVFHYLKLVAVVVLFGSALGLAAGIAFGEAMIASYRGFFRLPALAFELTLWSVLAGLVISLATASLGVAAALRRVIALAPAVAMRPAAPLRFHRSWIERLLSAKALTPRRVLALRNFTGRPLRSALTVIGIAVAVPMVVLGLFWQDAIERMIEIQFSLVERGNATVTFPRPLSRDVIGDLARESGVLAAEGLRIVPVRLRAGHRSYLTSVIGLPAGAELRRPHDAELRPIDVASEGITLTRRLAERINVKRGEIVTIDVMEGKRRRIDLPASAIVDETMGMSSYMEIDTLNRMTGEGAVVSAAALFVEPVALPALLQRFKQLPVVESVSVKAYTLASFLDKIAGLVLVSAGILTGFAVIVAVGVVYNSSRIALQERAWELASLRVLGFTRAEVAHILFSQFAAEVVLAVPIGLLLSQWVVTLIARFHSNESFQIPGVIDARTYLTAAAIIVAAAFASGYIVRRRVDRLDLVSALKARD